MVALVLPLVLVQVPLSSSRTSVVPRASTWEVLSSILMPAQNRVSMFIDLVGTYAVMVHCLAFTLTILMLIFKPTVLQCSLFGLGPDVNLTRVLFSE